MAEARSNNSSAAQFGFSGASRGLMVFGLLGFVPFTALGVYAALQASGRQSWLLWLYTAFFGAIVGVCLRGFQKTYDRVVVNDEGLEYLPRRGPTVSLRWDAIARVESHDGWQYLGVKGTDGAAIRLDYGLNNLDKLREILLTRTAARRNAAPPRMIFQRSALSRLTQLMCALLVGGGGVWLAYEMAAYGEGSVATFAFAEVLIGGGSLFLFVSFISNFAENWRVTITDKDFLVRSLIRRRTINFNGVSTIELYQSGAENTFRRTTVAIDYSGNRRLGLTGFGQDHIELYDTLRRVWLATREPVAVHDAASRALAPAATIGPTVNPTPDHTGNASALPSEFSTGLRPVALLMGAGPIVLAIALAIWAHGVPGTPVLYIGLPVSVIVLAGYALYALWEMPLRYVVGQAELAIAYLPRRRVVPYSAITNVELGKALDSGVLGEVVRIELQGGETLVAKLGRRTAVFSDVLHAAWRSYSGVSFEPRSTPTLGK